MFSMPSTFSRHTAPQPFAAIASAGVKYWPAGVVYQHIQPPPALQHARDQLPRLHPLAHVPDAATGARRREPIAVRRTSPSGCSRRPTPSPVRSTAAAPNSRPSPVRRPRAPRRRHRATRQLEPSPGAEPVRLARPGRAQPRSGIRGAAVPAAPLSRDLRVCRRSFRHDPRLPSAVPVAPPRARAFTRAPSALSAAGPRSAARPRRLPALELVAERQP